VYNNADQEGRNLFKNLWTLPKSKEKTITELARRHELISNVLITQESEGFYRYTLTRDSDIQPPACFEIPL